MRESVRNKRKMTIFAITIAVLLVLSITIGLIFSSMGGSIVDSDIVGGTGDVADLSWSNSDIGSANGSPSGTQISDSTGLTNLINSNGTGYLTRDVSFVGDSNQLSTKTFTGTLDGNGHTITLTANMSSWASASVADSGGTLSTGVFVAINKGTIKNVKFKMTNGNVRSNMALATNGNAKIWTGGVVCGSNDGGTISNVSLTLDNTYLGFHYQAGAERNTWQKIIAGGICGKQNGTLHRAYVNYISSTLEVNAKNSNHMFGTSLHFATAGGVFGAFTGTDAAKKTSNLMCKADEGSTLKARTEGPTGANNYVYKTLGAVSGVSLKDVRGVVWDFRGNFTVEDGRVCNGNDNWFIEANYPLEERAAAYCGKPTGYYSPVNTHLVLNDIQQCNDFTGNVFGEGRTLPSTDNEIHYQPSRNSTGNPSSGRIDASKYDFTRFGDLQLSFTDTVYDLQVSKTLPAPGSNVTMYDVIWRAGVQGSATDDSNYTMSNNKSFSGSFALNTALNYEVSTGKRFKTLNRISNQTFTGRDYLDIFASQAFNAHIDEIKNHMGVADASFDKTKAKFMIEDTTQMTTLVYPRVVGNVIVRTAKSGDAYKDFAYIDDSVRFAFETTTIPELVMLPGDLNARSGQPYAPITFNTGWDKIKDVTVRFLPSSSVATNTIVKNNAISVANKIIDKIEYRQVGTENYTTVENVSYVNNDADGHLGATFQININTPTNGAAFEFIAYCNGNQVAFATTTAGDFSGPFRLGTMYIDNIDPIMDTANVNYLAERWYNVAQNSIEIPISDANSGVDLSGIIVNKKSYTSATQEGEYWGIIGSANYTYTGGVLRLNFADHAKYQIQVSDRAGNRILSAEFETKIDTFKPVVGNIEYFYRDIDGNEFPYSFETNGRLGQTVFAKVTTTLGHSGGRLTYYVDGDESGVDNTADNVVRQENGVYLAEIKNTNNDVSYSFYITAVATDNDDANPIVSEIKTDTAKVSVGQIIVTITIDKLNIKGSLSKVYDGDEFFDVSTIGDNANLEILGSYADLGENANRINELVEVSGYFIRNYEGTGTNWEYVSNASQNLVLILEVRAKVGFNFAIKNNQQQNNIYPFVIGGEYTINGATTIADKISIEKKEITTLKVKNDSKVYWEPMPKFEFESVVGLIEGDTIDDLSIEFTTDASQTANAGMYYVTANIKDDCTNYYFNPNNLAGTRGEFRITRAIIPNISFENEINSITCFDIPDIRAYFYDVENNRRYLEVIYKNQDREEIEFIPGKRATLGTYFYIVLLDEETLKNYVNIGDPNMLIGRFEVVGDEVRPGISFEIRDLDIETSEIEVEFVNGIIDFRSLMRFNDFALSAKMKIYYGAAEYTTSNIQAVGNYYVTLKVLRGDNRYAPFEKEYTVKVIPATIKATSQDLIAPTEEVAEGETPVDGVYFTNKAVNLSIDNISDGLKSKLKALLTPEQISNGGIAANYKFTFAYEQGGRVIKPENVVNKGEYTVGLVITGDNIKNIELQTTFKILTRELSVDFDLDNFAQDVTVDKENMIVSKTFTGLTEQDTIYLSVTDEFERTLWSLFGINSSTEESAIPYHFSNNAFVNATPIPEVVTFGYKFGRINDNVKFINNTITVDIKQKIINVDVTGFDPNNDNYFNGTREILFTSESIQELIDSGVQDPYSTDIDGIYFGIENYISQGVEVIRDRETGKLGLKVPNSGIYKINVRMRTANQNFRIGNGSIDFTILKAPVDSAVSYIATYYQNGKMVDETLIDGVTLEVEYSGNFITFEMSDEGKQWLQNLSVSEDQITMAIEELRNASYSHLDGDIKNAGTYRVKISIDNQNIASTPLQINVVVNKKQIGDAIGKFDPDVWYVNGNRPNEEQAENGVMYTREVDENQNILKEWNYSLRLVDEAEILAAGFEIVYKYNGVESPGNFGVTQAGNYTVTAEISYPADYDNWEVRVVELWRLDSNGDFYYENSTVSKDSEGNDLLPNDNAIVNKVKQVINFTVLKADLQVEIENLGAAAVLADKTVEYNGKPHELDFTEAQYQLFEKHLLLADVGKLTEKNKKINANEYTIVASFYKLMADGITKDPNYESTDMEAALIITPIQVKVQFEFDDKYLNSKGELVYGEGDHIEIRAFYMDMYNRKIYIDSLKIEIVKGKGDEIDFSNLPTDKETQEEYIPGGGNYQVTPTISDTNYTYDEEELINFLRFKVKDETGATNTALYILLAIFIVLVIATVLVIVYMKKMFNPAVQELDLDD